MACMPLSSSVSLGPGLPGRCCCACHDYREAHPSDFELQSTLYLPRQGAPLPHHAVIPGVLAGKSLMSAVSNLGKVQDVEMGNVADLKPSNVRAAKAAGTGAVTGGASNPAYSGPETDTTFKSPT